MRKPCIAWNAVLDNSSSVLALFLSIVYAYGFCSLVPRPLARVTVCTLKALELDRRPGNQTKGLGTRPKAWEPARGPGNQTKGLGTRPKALKPD